MTKASCFITATFSFLFIISSFFQLKNLTESSFNSLFLISADEAQEAEAVQVLGAILELRENQAVQTASVMCNIYFTTAMMYLLFQDIEKVGCSFRL